MALRQVLRPPAATSRARPRTRHSGPRLEIALTFRAVTLLDAPLLYRWRQQAEQAAWYVGTPVTLLQHRQWLTRRLRCQLVKLRVWSEGGRVRGAVRIDSDGSVSFSAESPEVARSMLMQARNYARQYGDRLKCCIDAGDDDAAQALLASGFTESHSVRFFIYKP